MVFQSKTILEVSCHSVVEAVSVTVFFSHSLFPLVTDGSRANKKPRKAYGRSKATEIVPGVALMQPPNAKFDEDYDPDDENVGNSKARKRKRGVEPISFHDKKRESADSTGPLQLESTRRPVTRSAAKQRRKTPEVYSIESSDSEPETVSFLFVGPFLKSTRFSHFRIVRFFLVSLLNQKHTSGMPSALRLGRKFILSIALSSGNQRIRICRSPSRQLGGVL